MKRNLDVFTEGNKIANSLKGYTENMYVLVITETGSSWGRYPEKNPNGPLVTDHVDEMCKFADFIVKLANREDKVTILSSSDERVLFEYK